MTDLKYFFTSVAENIRREKCHCGSLGNLFGRYAGNDQRLCLEFYIKSLENPFIYDMVSINHDQRKEGSGTLSTLI